MESFLKEDQTDNQKKQPKTKSQNSIHFFPSLAWFLIPCSPPTSRFFLHPYNNLLSATHEFQAHSRAPGNYSHRRSSHRPGIIWSSTKIRHHLLPRLDLARGDCALVHLANWLSRFVQKRTTKEKTKGKEEHKGNRNFFLSNFISFPSLPVPLLTPSRRASLCGHSALALSPHGRSALDLWVHRLVSFALRVPPGCGKTRAGNRRRVGAGRCAFALCRSFFDWLRMVHWRVQFFSGSGQFACGILLPGWTEDIEV